MRNMKKIALDFDSVLSDTMVAWTKKYNAKHNTEFTKDHIEKWSFWKQKEFGFERSYALVFFRESWSDWKNLPATEPDLDKRIIELSEFGQVDIVTNIEKDYFGNVKNWIDEQNISVNDIIFSECKNKIKDFDYNLYIDDDPDLAKDAHSENKNCFIYHQKWNSHIENSKTVLRIYSLTDAITEISKNGL